MSPIQLLRALVRPQGHALLMLLVLFISAVWSSDGMSGLPRAAKRSDTQVMTSPIPLNLTMPDDFRDVTKSVYGELLPDDASVAVYCDAADGQLLHDQLRAKRVEEQAGKGCFFIQLDRSSSYDAGGKRFSVEHDVEAMKKWPPSTGVPRFDMKVLSFAKRQIRSVPTLTFVQDVTNEAGRTKIHFMYMARDANVWLIKFIPGKDEDRGTAIWTAFIDGL